MAIQCLEKLDVNRNGAKVAFNCDHHTFNTSWMEATVRSLSLPCLHVCWPLGVWVLLCDGTYLPVHARRDTACYHFDAQFCEVSCARAAYLVVADEQYGRQIPFAFLDRVKAEFAEKYAESSRTLHAHSLDKTLGCGLIWTPAFPSGLEQDALLALALRLSLAWRGVACGEAWMLSGNAGASMGDG